MNAITESLKIMQRAIDKAAKKGICPECGSNTLQREEGMLMTEHYSNLTWYDSLEEPGWYRCENGHEFKTTVDTNGFIQIV